MRLRGDERIGMNAHEQVGTPLSRALYAMMQRHKVIGVACERDLEVGVLVEARLEFACNGQHHVLFTRAAPADGAYRPYAIAEASPYSPPQARLEVAEEVVRGGKIVYAGFWKRFAAYVIDGFVIGAVNYAIAIPISVFAAVGLGGSATSDNPFGSGAAIALIGVMYLIQILLPGIYFGWMQSSRHQASLGKMAIGIKVTRGDGAPIQFWRGFGRYYATILSTLIVFIGFLMAAFTERKQALHDMVCDTLVVDKYAFTAHPEWQREELGTVTIVVLALGGLMALGLVALIAVLGAALSGGIH